MRGAIGVGLVLGLAALTGCERTAHEDTPTALRSFIITVPDEAARGSVDRPLPFPSAIAAEVPITLEARDASGGLAVDFDGVARIGVEPGQILRGDSRVQFQGGRATALAAFRFSYGRTHLWVEDVGEDPLFDCADEVDNDADGLVDLRDPDCLRLPPSSVPAPGSRATYAAGVSAPLFFAPPRITDLQFSPRCTTDSPLGGENVTIDAGRLIVTGTTQSGLYVTDLERAADGYASVFLFTFSSPEGVRRGDRLCSITGNIAEFIGNSQLNFPDFVVADFDRNGRIDPDEPVPCDLIDPQVIGAEAMPEPRVLTEVELLAEGSAPPGPDFYRTCGPGDVEIPDLEDATDCRAACTAADAAFGAETCRDSVIDCRRDNFAMEPWEHALVAFEDVTVSTRFENCDIDGDGQITRGRGAEEGECETDCADDPLCTDVFSLDSFGQFGAGLRCTDPADSSTCVAKVFISPRDSIGTGSTGFVPQQHAGERYDRVVGHLRQAQPGPGVQTIWIIEPRALTDFTPLPRTGDDAAPATGGAP